MMRFVTFVKKSRRGLGLRGRGEEVIDLGELNRRFLKAGAAPFLSGMLAFIDAGGGAINLAKKAAKYVAGKDEAGLKNLRQAGALYKANQVKIISPTPEPRKNVVLLGVKYKEHIEEGARARSIELKNSESPDIITKPTTPVTGHLAKVVHSK